MLTILIILFGGYLLICGFVYLRQDSLIFFPTRESAEASEDAARRSGFEPWRNSRGELIGWVSRGGNPANALLVFHGNGGNALMRTYLASLPGAQADGQKTYLLEYPGYGARVGVTSQESFVKAGVEAVDEVKRLGGKRIWVLGESLGTGVASQVAAQRPDQIDAVFLLTPFDSLSNAAAVHYPWLPCQWLVRHPFDSATALKSYPGPVAFLVAGQDSVVPARLGKRLYEEREGPKRLWVDEEADHNDGRLLMGNWAEASAWVREARRNP